MTKTKTKSTVFNPIIRSSTVWNKLTNDLRDQSALKGFGFDWEKWKMWNNLMWLVLDVCENCDELTMSFRLTVMNEKFNFEGRKKIWSA